MLYILYKILHTITALIINRFPSDIMYVKCVSITFCCGHCCGRVWARLQGAQAAAAAIAADHRTAVLAAPAVRVAACVSISEIKSGNGYLRLGMNLPRLLMISIQ